MSKVIFITGGGSGIGKAIAELFAKKNYNVVITGRDGEKLNRAAKDIEAKGGQCWPISLDIGDAKAVHSCVEDVIKKWEKVDVLVNNAGIALGSPKSFHQQTIEDIQTVINTNILGTLMVTHAILQQSMMKQDKGGKGTIINISSITGLEAPPMGEATYHTSKAAIEGFSNVLRQETIGSNVRILVVRPGFVGGTTNFHLNRLNDNQEAEKEVFQGLEPVLETDVADAVEYLVDAPERVSIKAIDVVPTAQRSLATVDREWNERNLIRKE